MLDKDCFFKDVGSMQQSNFHEAYEDDPADPQTFMDFHSSNTGILKLAHIPQYLSSHCAHTEK